MLRFRPPHCNQFSFFCRSRLFPLVGANSRTMATRSSSSTGTLDAAATTTSCCPPGSIGAPPPTFDQEKQGSLLTIGTTTATPCYYVTPPASSSASKKAMVLFPDVWGFQSRILQIADWLAQQADCHVLVCDFFRGETNDDHPDMKAWFTSVPYEPNVAQDVASCVEYLQKEKGVTALGAMGFCWGGWAIAKTCQGSSSSSLPPALWKLVVSPHPSFKIEPWVFGGDDVALMQSMTCPVLLMPASNDSPYTKPESPAFQAMPHKGSKSIAFEEMAHGWTTRGDLEKDPIMKRDVEAALQATLEFVQKHL